MSMRTNCCHFWKPDKMATATTGEFTQLSYLIVNVYIIHDHSFTRPSCIYFAGNFQCCICHKTFEFKYRYERHLRTLSHQRLTKLLSLDVVDSEVWEDSDTHVFQSSVVSTISTYLMKLIFIIFACHEVPRFAHKASALHINLLPLLSL